MLNTIFTLPRALTGILKNRLQLEQNENILWKTTGEATMTSLIHDLVSFVSIGAFITTLALWLVAV